MRNQFSLNELWAQYQGGGLEKRTMEGKIFQFFLAHPERLSLKQHRREEVLDFLSWAYPRLSRSIDRYQATGGASFHTYISTVLSHSSWEYRVQEQGHRFAEYACWRADFADAVAQSTEPDYPASGHSEPIGERGEEVPALPRVSNPRQILMLLLKSYYFVSDDFISRIAPAVGMGEAALKGLLDRVRELRLNRDLEIQALGQRIHSQFFRCIVFKQRLAGIPRETLYYERMEMRLERARKRLDSMKKRYRGFRFDASNRQVAQVLGVAKGTVDSGLHEVWKKYQGFFEGMTGGEEEPAVGVGRRPCKPRPAGGGRTAVREGEDPVR